MLAPPPTIRAPALLGCQCGPTAACTHLWIPSHSVYIDFHQHHKCYLKNRNLSVSCQEPYIRHTEGRCCWQAYRCALGRIHAISSLQKQIGPCRHAERLPPCHACHSAGRRRRQNPDMLRFCPHACLPFLSGPTLRHAFMPSIYPPSMMKALIIKRPGSLPSCGKGRRCGARGADKLACQPLPMQELPEQEYPSHPQGPRKGSRMMGRLRQQQRFWHDA